MEVVAISQKVLRNEIRELIAEKKRNMPRYAQKNLASEIGMRASILSEFLNEKRILKYKSAQRYFRPVFSPEKWQSIEDVFHFEEGRVSIVNREISMGNEAPCDPKTHDAIELEADPMHAALLVLFEIEGPELKIERAAELLGLSVSRACEIMERLAGFKLVIRTPSNSYRKTGLRYIPTRIYQKPRSKHSHWTTQKKRRYAALFSLAQERIARELGGDCYQDLTVAIDPADLPILEKKIHDLIHAFNQAQKSSKAVRVYSLLFGLFPLSK